jgi:hypothetical protein
MILANLHMRSLSNTRLEEDEGFVKAFNYEILGWSNSRPSVRLLLNSVKIYAMKGFWNEAIQVATSVEPYIALRNKVSLMLSMHEKTERTDANKDVESACLSLSVITRIREYATYERCDKGFDARMSELIDEIMETLSSDPCKSDLYLVSLSTSTILEALNFVKDPKRKYSMIMKLNSLESEFSHYYNNDRFGSVMLIYAILLLKRAELEPYEKRKRILHDASMLCSKASKLLNGFPDIKRLFIASFNRGGAALKIFEDNGFSSFRILNTARIALEQAYKYSQEIKVPRAQAYCHMNLGSIYRYVSMFAKNEGDLKTHLEKSFFHYSTALRLSRKVNDLKFRGLSHLNMASYLLTIPKHRKDGWRYLIDEAEEHIKEGEGFLKLAKATRKEEMVQLYLDEIQRLLELFYIEKAESRKYAILQKALIVCKIIARRNRNFAETYASPSIKRAINSEIYLIRELAAAVDSFLQNYRHSSLRNILIHKDFNPNSKDLIRNITRLELSMKQKSRQIA